jgi:hypothetical protein
LKRSDCFAPRPVAGRRGSGRAASIQFQDTSIRLVLRITVTATPATGRIATRYEKTEACLADFRTSPLLSSPAARLETTQCYQTVATLGVAAAEEFGVEENLDAFERPLRLHDIGAEHQYVCIVMFA